MEHKLHTKFTALFIPPELFGVRVRETIISVFNIFEVVWSWEPLVEVGSDEMDSTYPVAPNSTNLDSRYACSFWSFITSWSSSFSFCWRLYCNRTKLYYDITNIMDYFIPQCTFEHFATMPVSLICLAMVHVGGEPRGNHVAELACITFNILMNQNQVRLNNTLASAMNVIRHVLYVTIQDNTNLISHLGLVS